MRWIKRTLAVLAILIVVAVAASYLIPSRYHVERSVSINAAPEAIYPLVANLKRWEEWSAWNKELDPTMTREFTGSETGAGAKMSWQGEKVGRGAMTITAADPKTGLRYELDFENGQHLSSGLLSFTPEGAGTKVLWTNDGDCGLNPIARYFSLLMDRFMGPDFEKGLQALKRAAEGAR